MFTPRALDLVLPEQLEGERVVVRTWRTGDGSALWDAVDESRIRLREWMFWVDSHDSEAFSHEYVRHMQRAWAERTDLALGIWRRTDGRLLGATGFHNIDWAVPSMEIGYWIRDGEVGNGYVIETVRLLLAMAFRDLGANRVGITCDANNERSRRVPEQLGFLLEGRLRNHARIPNGPLRDTLVYSILPGEWSVRQMDSRP